MTDTDALLPALAVVTALVAVWLLVPSPPRARARLGPDGPGHGTSRRPAWALRLFDELRRRTRPRPDAMSPRVRGLLAGVAGLGVLVLAGSLPWWMQALAAPLVGAAVYVGFALIEPPGVAKRRERIVLDLPQALDLLGSCLAAGLPLRRASTVVAEAMSGPLAEELTAVASRAELGLPERRAWLMMAEQPALREVAVDIGRAVGSGASLDRVLQIHARDARRRRRAQLENRARTVGVRSVLPLMACFLPAFLLIGIVPIVGGMISTFDFL